MEIETCVALISAFATTISAIFIAWQAGETRRSANSSNKAAEASEAALVVANESLELNRRQSEQSAFMVAEATRARLETNAPAVSMQFVDGDSARPISFLAGKPSDRESFRAKSVGDVFQLPQDAELWLYALFEVSFHNDGLVPVTIFSGATGVPMLQGYSWQPTTRLEVGGSEVMYLAVGASLAVWTESPEDKGKPRGEAGWVTELNGDSGVRLTQMIHIEGTLLEGSQTEGNFVLRSIGWDANWPSNLTKDQPKRTYWIGGQEIAALAPGEAFGVERPSVSP